MKLAEALSTGLQTTVIGMAIVFSVLAILMIIMILMKQIFYKDPAKQTKTAPQKAKEPAPVVAAPKNTVAEDMDEAELIAVLTAAVAASLNTSTYNLQIKSYRRVGNQAPAWNRAGLQETVNSRF